MIKPNQNGDDPELTRLVRDSDWQAFLLLVRPWERAVFLASNAILTNPARAEENAQAAILEGFSKLHTLRSSENFGVWLIQITINKARSVMIEGDGRLPGSSDRASCSEDESDYIPKDLSRWHRIPLETLAHDGLQKAVRRAFAQLPQESREVLMLKDSVHLSYQETAQALGLVVGQVKSRVRTARLRMRDALAPGMGGKWSEGDSMAHSQRSTAAGNRV